MKITRFIASALLVMSTGCTSILVATTDENGIQEDPGVRTAGTIVEDESIETKVTVNMKSMEPRKCARRWRPTRMCHPAVFA